jgi:hypothetical protein
MWIWGIGLDMGGLFLSLRRNGDKWHKLQYRNCAQLHAGQTGDGDDRRRVRLSQKGCMTLRMHATLFFSLYFTRNTSTGRPRRRRASVR